MQLETFEINQAVGIGLGFLSEFYFVVPSWACDHEIIDEDGNLAINDVWKYYTLIEARNNPNLDLSPICATTPFDIVATGNKDNCREFVLNSKKWNI